LKKEEAPVETIVPPAPVPFPKPVEANGTPIAIEEYRPEFKNLQAIIKDTDKLKYVLNKINTVNNFNFCRNKIQFVEVLRHECQWDKEGQHKGAVGRLLTELCKNEYLMEKVNDRETLIGYVLTEKGKFFITKHRDSKPVVPLLPTKEIKVDIPALLMNMRDKLQELSDVANKIAANETQKAELLQKIDHLDKENDELSKVLHQNKESQEVLSKLGQLITPLPIQGMRQHV
jgi:hypothetical protein